MYNRQNPLDYTLYIRFRMFLPRCSFVLGISVPFLVAMLWPGISWTVRLNRRTNKRFKYLHGIFPSILYFPSAVLFGSCGP
jgi:hypothetical protein